LIYAFVFFTYKQIEMKCRNS